MCACLAQVAMETSADDVLPSMIIGDFLYGETSEHMQLRLNEVHLCATLKTYTSEQWRQLLQTYYSTNVNYIGVCVRMLWLFTYLLLDNWNTENSTN
jgi:hypothetical protein